MGGTHDNPSSESSELQLSEDEKKILNLWDQLQQLRIGIAALRAERDVFSTHDATPTAEDTQKARDESIEAGALYGLHASVTDAILFANPTLQAIHGRGHANPIECDLLPYLKERDELSFSIASQSKKLDEALDEVSRTEREAVILTKKNHALAQTLLELLNEIEKTTREKVGDMNDLGETMQLELEVSKAKKRWTFMKATASAIVVGSGVNWVGDSELREVVLDPDED